MNNNSWRPKLDATLLPCVAAVASVEAASSSRLVSWPQEYSSMSDKITDRETEANQYHAMLASLGRTEEHDHRLAVHEAGHAVCARLLGQVLGGATVDPGPGYGGLVWRERYVPASTEGCGDASDVRECFSPLMPKAGEDHSAYADI